MTEKIILFILKIFSRLPFTVLYGISDFAYLILYKMVGYRVSVVRKNLSSSFPEKSEKELRQIEHRFYHWLCDYFVETVKLLTITEEEIKRRMKWEGMEYLCESFDRGQNVAVFLGHYCNWEWLSTTKLFMPAEYNSVVGLIYHGLRSDLADDIMLKVRSAHGGTMINKRKILRKIVELKRDKQSYLMGYIFDQGPKFENIHLWVDFLNRDTPVFTGAERLARKFNNTVLFLEAERIKRGYYKVKFIPVTSTPNELPEFEITKKCMAMLENSIRKEPSYYLWSHNRWKRTHEDYYQWQTEKEKEKAERQR